MFFRIKKSPSGQCLQLLESYRNAQGQPRHRVVVSLGDASIAEVDRPLVARLVEQRLRGQAELACVSQEARVLGLADGIAKRIEREGRWRAVPAPGCPGPSQGAGVVLDGVLADQITHTHTTPLGPSLVAWVLLRQACVGRKKTALVELSFGAARAYRAGEPDGDELVWEAGSAWR